MERLCPRTGDGVMAVRDVVQAAAGVGGGDKLYVEDVFSTYLYTGNGSTQFIENGIALGDTNAGPCVPFNGSQYLSRTSDLTGNSDGSTFTLSFWAFVTNTYSTIFRSNTGRVEVLISNNRVEFDFKNTSGTSIWRGNSASNTALNYQWNHILISVDAGSAAQIYINDVSSSISYVANTSGTFDFTDTSWGIGAPANGGYQPIQGKLTEFFFDKTYRNLGTVANRRLFITADGEPATGLASLNPLIYLPLNDTVSVGANEGTGGDFVPINGLSSSETGGPYTEAGYGQGGLVWIKNRSNFLDNLLFDTERGATKYLKSNTADDQFTAADTLTSFNADGFSLSTSILANGSAYGNYVGWTLRKAPKFFTVVKYTGGGSTQTIPHDLGGAVGCMFVKAYSGASSNWFVWHRGLATPASQRMQLNQTNAVFTDTGIWNNTSPTSTDFYVGAGGGNRANDPGVQYVAYLFAHNDAGGFGDDGQQNVISCGSFTTDGSGNATVDLGWEPQWVLFKASSRVLNWSIHDTMRGMPVDSVAAGLYPNLSNAESNNVNSGPTATGFTWSGYANETFVYVAIRRPMKTPESGTEVFNALARTGTGAAVTTSATFAPDLMIVTDRAKSLYSGTDVLDRLRANKYLITNGNQSESTRTQFLGFDAMTGVRLGADSSGFINFSSKNYIDWYFKRAPAVFDMVAYTGTGANTTQAHNLGVAPELMIVKKRSAADSWVVYSSEFGGTAAALYLNESYGAPVSTNIAWWNNTDPTASVFSLGYSGAVNQSGQTFTAYLFASCPGVSKVGSYTGNGSTQAIDCGFSNGARFVLIKRTDSTGDWMVWDTARGIVSGNDPRLTLNTTDPEYTGGDYLLVPSASGFTVVASSLVNGNNASFIFLAIA